jgi:hypothetical protein
MRSLLGRHLAMPWALALAFAAIAGFGASRDVFWTGDFYLEAYPAYEALMAGDLGGFVDRLPGYSGFTVTVGAPAALLTGALGGAETMAYRFSAVPGLLALAALGVAVAGPLRAAGNRAWPIFLLAAAGGGLTYQTLLYGHPEDLLATACAVGAVLAARAGMSWRAAALLVVAIVAKQWAVLAILPAAMAAPRHGLRIAAAGVVATAALLGIQLQPSASGGHAAITTTGLLFHPHQLFWPFGVPATPDFIEAGHGTRMGPGWLAPLVRPLIIGAGVAVAALWWLRSGPQRNRDDVLAVLALAMLLRCMLDPWNLVYYHLPLVVALAAWEARRGRDLPVLSVCVTAACWLSFVIYDAREGYGPYVLYLAWTIPLAVGLAVALLGRAPQRRPGFVRTLPAAASA